MRFKILITLLSLGCTAPLFAQDFIFPVLPKQSKTTDAIIPLRWKVIDTAYGDLNNDAQEDLALILEYHTSVKEKRAYGDNTTELITELQKPRILAVYFKSKNSRNYTLSLQNNDFILREDEGGSLGDPLRPLLVEENKITLSFEGGSIWKWILNYKFKYQNNDWYLLQAGNINYHGVSGEMTEKRYDFLTKKLTIVKGNMSDGISKGIASEEDLNIKMLRTFSTFKKPWTWEINPDNFL